MLAERRMMQSAEAKLGRRAFSCLVGEFTRSSFGALTRYFPRPTVFFFDGIGSIRSKLRIGTERDDERNGFYTQVVAGSIPAPPTNP
jgi:hypothetical protein